MQEYANKRNAGEDITLENKLKKLGNQQKLCERNFDMEIKGVSFTRLTYLQLHSHFERCVMHFAIRFYSCLRLVLRFNTSS